MFYIMSDKIVISPEQCRAARALLGWSREVLAERSRVGMATLADFEGGKRSPYERTLTDIRAALEDAGVEFIPSNGAGDGVRFRKARKRGGKR
jgi:transcriptional regulator with XRE-family HTH domain